MTLHAQRQSTRINQWGGPSRACPAIVQRGLPTSASLVPAGRSQMSGVAERIAVPFAGDGGGVGPLSWGQQSIWKEMARAGNSLAMTAVRTLEPDTTTDRYVDEFRFYLSRYQSMRTLLRF